MSQNMSQRRPVLKRIRATVTDTLSLRALEGLFERITSSNSENIVSSPEREKHIKFSFTSTISKALHSIREPEAENTPVTLPDLPTEIILDLAEYLPPSSHWSLSYSCWKIHNKMGASVAHILGSKLHCMLDRDRKNSPSKFFCNGCMDTHDSSLFSVSSLAQSSAKRRCLGIAGFMWICPHRIFSYSQAVSAREARETHDYGGNLVSIHWRWTTLRPIMRVTSNDAPSDEQVKEALRPLNASICPHLRFNNAYVASIYSQNCRKLRWKLKQENPTADCPCTTCSPQSPMAGGRCSYCGTLLDFIIKPERNGPETLRLVIMRDIEDVRSCTDHAWINQIADPADFEEYEKAWQATNEECDRKVGSLRSPLYWYM